jgi:hypothetical protein
MYVEELFIFQKDSTSTVDFLEYTVLTTKECE